MANKQPGKYMSTPRESLDLPKFRYASDNLRPFPVPRPRIGGI